MSMKISPLQTQSFKGHSAGRIKALYMQNSNLPAQIPIYNELRTIGQKHNFDVFIHNQDEIQSGTMKYTSPKHCEYELWSQDNKTILHKNGQTVVVSGMYMPQTEHIAAESFAKTRGVKLEKPELLLQGGNLFVGKKPDGKNYLIIGFKDIEVSAAHFYLKDKLGEVQYDDMDEFIVNLKLEKDGKKVADYEEFDRDFYKYGDMVIERLQKAFDVEKGDITILQQGQYHNDLVIRPLNYPYVLVNDEEMSEENLKKLEKAFRFDFKAKSFTKDLRKKLEEQKKEYANCDTLCKKLERKGFIPIRIGGGYGINTINFINSIVHQNGNDLIYITNSGISGNKYYEYLQALFEQDLKEKCPQITKTYFVKGAIIQNKSNIILEYLKQFKGGIHCLCAEEMQE